MPELKIDFSENDLAPEETPKAMKRKNAQQAAAIERSFESMRLIFLRGF